MIGTVIKGIIALSATIALCYGGHSYFEQLIKKLTFKRLEKLTVDLVKFNEMITGRKNFFIQNRSK
jgi:hypothetical protein